MARGVKTQPGLKPGQKLCRYEYDYWIGMDNRLYVKVTGIQWERATEESFFLAGKRRMRHELERMGLPRKFADGIGRTEEWDRAYNIADRLLEAVTYRTLEPLPLPERGETAA